MGHPRFAAFSAWLKTKNRYKGAPGTEVASRTDASCGGAGGGVAGLKACRVYRMLRFAFLKQERGQAERPKAECLATNCFVKMPKRW